MSDEVKRWGAIDIGSNSIRFLVATVRKRKLEPIWTELETTRLGHAVGLSGLLTAEAIERTMIALQKGLATMEELSVSIDRVAAFATSAVREASNGLIFCQKVQDQIGLTINVLSGEREGRLSYEGALALMDSEVTDNKVPVVIDIGGGSAEVVWYDQRWWRKSLPLGALRVTEKKWSKEEIGQIWHPVTSLIHDSRSEKAKTLIGVGGTVTTLGAMILALPVYDPDRVHGTIISQDQTKYYAETLSAMDGEERKKIAGLQPTRADIIPAGLTVLAQFMEQAGFNSIVISETDLLHQALLEKAMGRWT
ncbi:Ppx/GppA family phosphatase [Heliorestis acidaminivorans]|uniref:Ppx/GppA family phosphatase n=1 Tax=Heliorestis acidaminivorans TaxID=553427 RepID=A0A6I0ESZ8_9FIRM|nr:Ppx/GppA family phosphatase [Heliorestis acidaminivorans]KAB2953048.1 Ppx/GppA family phosphatase [Heliorestis acidaminivorans]